MNRILTRTKEEKRGSLTVAPFSSLVVLERIDCLISFYIEKRNDYLVMASSVSVDVVTSAADCCSGCPMVIFCRLSMAICSATC